MILCLDTRKDAKSSAGRNKYIEPSSPFVPPVVPAWRDALANVDTTPSKRIDHGTSFIDSGYAFPEPGLFYGVTTEERRARYISNWLQTRVALLYRYMSSSSSARPLNNQQWRTWLNYATNSAPSSSGSANTVAESRRTEVQGILGSCLQEVGVNLNEIPDSSEQTVFWQEQQLSIGVVPELAITQEILWELYELNFRSELVALDRCAAIHSDSSVAREDLIVACFPGNGPLLVTDVSLAGQGLASQNQAKRLPYLLALKRLMKEWDGELPPCVRVEKPVEQYSEEEISELEKDIATFYTQSFFNHFGRAAVIPHGLEVFQDST